MCFRIENVKQVTNIPLQFVHLHEGRRCVAMKQPIQAYILGEACNPLSPTTSDGFSRISRIRIVRGDLDDLVVVVM